MYGSLRCREDNGLRKISPGVGGGGVSDANVSKTQRHGHYFHKYKYTKHRGYCGLNFRSYPVINLFEN